MGSSPCYLDPIVIPLIRGSTVLDAACGLGRWGNLIRTNYWEAGIDCPTIDGFDAFEPNVRICQATQCYRKVWQHRLPNPIDGKWDTVVACEIIEHLSEQDARRAVEMLEKVAARRIIFTTPNFVYLRGVRETADGFNPDEAHLSHIPRSWFKNRGYKISGAGWGNPESSLVRLLGGLRVRGVRALSGFPQIFPSLGYVYVAHKDFG